MALFIPKSNLTSPLFELQIDPLKLCLLLGVGGVWRKLLSRTPAVVTGWGYAVLLTLALILAPVAGRAFVYFQF